MEIGDLVDRIVKRLRDALVNALEEAAASPDPSACGEVEVVGTLPNGLTMKLSISANED